MNNRPFSLALSAIYATALLLVGCSQGGGAVSASETSTSPTTVSEATSGSEATDTIPRPATETEAEAEPDDGDAAADQEAGETSGLAAELAKAPALPPAQDVEDLSQDAALKAALSPVSVSIERLGLANTTVRAEGIEPNGDMSVPPAKEIGWYEYGPAPGQSGSTVLAGHIAYNGVDGAFRHLDRMEKGDRVVIQRQDGTSATFVVSDTIKVAKTSLPFDELFARSGPPRLALITCGGEFDYNARSYKDNFVVVADLVEG